MGRRISQIWILAFISAFFVGNAQAECVGGQPDGERQGFEECDPGIGGLPADFGAVTCEMLCMEDSPPAEGQISGIDCNPDCTFDLSGCQMCGNGILEGSEICDDDQFDPSAPDCPNGGTRRCQSNCMDIDETGCFRCGNGILEGSEACEAGLPISATCTIGGEPSCGTSCQIDFSTCSQCGNFDVEEGEECDDGNMLPGDGCGALCQSECGDGIPNYPAEECDDGNQVSGDGCSSLCNVEGDRYYGDGGEPRECVLSFRFVGTPAGFSHTCVDGESCDLENVARQCTFGIVTGIHPGINPACPFTDTARIDLVGPGTGPTALSLGDRERFLDPLQNHLESFGIAVTRTPDHSSLSIALPDGPFSGSVFQFEVTSLLSVPENQSRVLSIQVTDEFGDTDTDSLFFRCNADVN